MSRDKRSWKRVPNTGPGQVVGNKYEFTSHLKKVGDFVETYSFPTVREAKKVCWAAHIWAFRKHRQVTCTTVYNPDGYGMRIELTSMYR